MGDVVPMVCFHNRPGREELTEKKDFYHSDTQSFLTRGIELICQYYSRTMVTLIILDPMLGGVPSKTAHRLCPLSNLDSQRLD